MRVWRAGRRADCWRGHEDVVVLTACPACLVLCTNQGDPGVFQVGSLGESKRSVAFIIPSGQLGDVKSPSSITDVIIHGMNVRLKPARGIPLLTKGGPRSLHSADTELCRSWSDNHVLASFSQLDSLSDSMSERAARRAGATQDNLPSRFTCISTHCGSTRDNHWIRQACVRSPKSPE